MQAWKVDVKIYYMYEIYEKTEEYLNFLFNTSSWNAKGIIYGFSLHDVQDLLLHILHNVWDNV
jgi:hypothetical protein